MVRVSIGPGGGWSAGAAAGWATGGALPPPQPARGASAKPVAASEAADRNSRRDVMADPPAGDGARLTAPGEQGLGSVISGPSFAQAGRMAPMPEVRPRSRTRAGRALAPPPVASILARI